MRSIFEQLQDDHKQLVRVLYHLEREIKALNGMLADAASIERILDILDYIQVYPEIWHHPVEDVIFATLLEKEVPDAQLLSGAMEEHAVLELLTEKLHHYLNKVAAGDDVSPARFIKSTNDYINRQLRHMEFEQKHLFPMAEAYLCVEDWDKIESSLKGQQQLLEEPRLQQFATRYQSIVNSSPVTAH